MQIFSKLDLQSGYQVWIKVGDEPKMTCVMCYESYEFIVMPIGLTNTPATFCSLMNHIFHAFLDKFVVVYLNNILIYSKTMEEHLKHLWAVFNTLHAHQLYLNPTKCIFSTQEVDFLGHIVGHN